MKNIKGIKKAVGDYQRANKGGAYSPRYGVLMYNEEENILWTDEFYDLGHNSYRVYGSEYTHHLSNLMEQQGIEVNMKNVKEYIEKHYRY